MVASKPMLTLYNYVGYNYSVDQILRSSTVNQAFSHYFQRLHFIAYSWVFLLVPLYDTSQWYASCNVTPILLLCYCSSKLFFCID